VISPSARAPEEQTRGGGRAASAAAAGREASHVGHDAARAFPVEFTFWGVDSAPFSHYAASRARRPAAPHPRPRWEATMGVLRGLSRSLRAFRNDNARTLAGVNLHRRADVIRQPASLGGVSLPCVLVPGVEPRNRWDRGMHGPCVHSPAVDAPREAAKGGD
jgi:hypothetical protein